MTRRQILVVLSSGLGLTALAQDQYTGPTPPKKDIPYLLLASRLVETEVKQAEESKSKGHEVFSVPGPTSSARTSLPEPIFLLVAGQLDPNQLGLYRFDVKDGRREVAFSSKHKDEDKVLHIGLRKLTSNLFRIEVEEMLDPGEYCLSPEGQNIAFCFTVF